MRPQLFTAGPIQISQRILHELAQPLLYHRSPEFVFIYEEVVRGMQYVLQTVHDVIIFTASGTGGMEAAVVNLLSREDKIVVLDQGKFSARWAEICSCYGVDVQKIEFPWGASVDAQKVAQALRAQPNIKAIFMNHCETSTGALNDIAAISKVIKQNSNALVVVDAISTVGVVPFKMDEWGVDVTVATSNKGLLNPPGLAFVALSANAWNCVHQSNLPKYYFSFLEAGAAFTSGKGAAFTPAIPLVMGMYRALRDIKNSGIEQRWDQYHRLATAFRTAIQAMGLEILPIVPSDSLIVIHIPAPAEAHQIISILKEKYKIIISSGQGKLKNKVIRIGFFGEIKFERYADILSALESILIDSGFPLQRGASVKTFYDMLNQTG